MQLQELLFTLLLHFLLFSCCVPSATSTKASTAPNIKENTGFATQMLYRRSDVILTEIQALVLRHPDILSLEDLRADADGYSAEMRVVTVELGSKNTSSAEKLRLLLDFGQHGRELVTTEVALRLLSTLVGEHSFGSNARLKLQQILTNSVVKVIPIENINGRKKVEAGDFCERKNGRGVDTNRNWGLDWGKKEKDYDPAEEYPGTAPFSEPESRILKGLAERFHPHLWVNVHSGMEALFMPYDHKTTGPSDGSAESMRILLETINRLHCRNSCVVGSGGGSVGYLAHGTATDFMFDAVGVPIAFTFEIFGNPNAGNDACFRMFNPISANHLEQVVSDWSAAFITLILNLPTALTRMPGRVWSQAQHIEWSGAVGFKSEGNYSFRQNTRGRSIWPGINAGIVHVFSPMDTERTMLQFVIFLFILWGCIFVFAWFKFCNNCRRWKKPAARFADRRSVFQV